VFHTFKDYSNPLKGIYLMIPIILTMLTILITVTIGLLKFAYNNPEEYEGVVDRLIPWMFKITAWVFIIVNSVIGLHLTGILIVSFLLNYNQFISDNLFFIFIAIILPVLLLWMYTSAIKRVVYLKPK